MSGAVIIEEVAAPSVTIGFDTGPQIELTGGAASVEFEQLGTTVQVFEAEPNITDLVAQYRLLSN